MTIPMTGIEMHRNQMNPIAQTVEDTNNKIMDKLTLKNGQAVAQAQNPTLDRHQDPCQEHRRNKNSMIPAPLQQISSSPSHLHPIGDSSEVSQEMTHKDLSPTINSNNDNQIHSSQQESKNHLWNPIWMNDNLPLHTELMNTNNSRKIYNRWLNKEVPYTTIVSSSTKSPFMTSSSPVISNNPTNSSQNLDTQRTTSNTPTTTRHNRTWDQTTHPQPKIMSNNPSSTTQISTNNSKPINLNRADSRLSNENLHRENPHSTQTKVLKAYNSDSNLATSYTEERRQNFLKKHREVPAYNKDNSRETACKNLNKSLPAQQAPRPKVERSHQYRPHQPEQSLPPRGELNKRIAEILWGKQLGLEENQPICQNSLPRQSLKAKNKSYKSIDAQLDEVEVEIQDILAQPLIAEIMISSPSLFDETSTTNSSQSSPPITAEFRDSNKIY
jgi:hypothetical protein